MKNVIDHSSVVAFGDLKEGATVVDYSVRKAWEAFFHLDFDYSWLPEIRRYVPGLSQVRQSHTSRSKWKQFVIMRNDCFLSQKTTCKFTAVMSALPEVIFDKKGPFFARLSNWLPNKVPALITLGTRVGRENIFPLFCLLYLCPLQSDFPKCSGSLQ
jgi:hypothetical protein